MRLRPFLLKIIDHRVTPYVIVGVIALFMAAPFLWMTLSAFKTLQETFMSPPTYFPKDFTLETMAFTWFQAPIPTYLKNSLIVCLTATLIIVVASIFTAYALSQYPYRGSNIILGLFLFTRTIPPLAMLLPYYLIMRKLGLLNTRLSVILYLIYLSYPLVVWLLKGFFDAFPRDLIDAAIVDGCSRTGTIFRVVLPITAGSVGAISVVAFLWAWNEFFAPYLFIHYDELKPITVGLYYFVGDEVTYWNRMCAAGIYAVVPSLAFFLIAQRYIIKGLTEGALKY
ncbi:MAG TPA: carbohydrate ABC transporter permease [Caldilineae bacterium]|nr:carbohydrate ABC transporter permease [Caldilineae bacterium]